MRYRSRKSRQTGTIAPIFPLVGIREANRHPLRTKFIANGNIF